MPIINNPFNGKLNLDVSEYRISDGDYIDALNITKDAEGTGQDRVVSNILGNSLLLYTLPNGENKIIGFYPDKIRNKAYYFLWNSNGYNTILYYDANNETVVKVLESKTDSDGIDILNFNPSYKVLSVNIFYRDDEGDILFFNDKLNPPKNINVIATYSPWKLEYLLVAKAPPVMPPKVVYENDNTITINNLRNKLFQFSYRYVYDNNEKSVWSSKSIVPLPQQPALSLTDNVFTDNSRISVSVSTGGDQVKAIEISFRETNNGVTSNWYLIQSFIKENLFISNNTLYTYKFFNDGIYSQLDIIEATQLQDWVPQKANASELANGNVLLYSGITEGYDKTDMDLVATSAVDLQNFYFDYCGLLFFATCNGNSSGSQGTDLKIYLYGTGTNTSGIVSTLNNANGRFVIDAYSLTGVDIGCDYLNLSVSISVNSLLSSISSELVLKGWSQFSLIDNILTMNFASGFNLSTSGVKYISNISQPDNTKFANAWDSGYQFAIQYFDAQGRTIGAQSDIDASINTVSSNLAQEIAPQAYLTIKNRPPLEASYYQVLRSNNTTYNKRLYWISDSAYSSIDVVDEPRFIYIGIDNINNYNESISSTQNVVSYTYADGDRIKFLKRYSVDNNITILNQYDYEIVGIETSIQYNIYSVTPNYDTYSKTGTFLKIKYPTDDISVNFKFTGTEDFQHYEIFLYNYSSNSSSNQRFFYEFGKCYGIGNAGTNLAFHYGDIKQSATNPVSQPASVTIVNGDLFYRKRKVPFDDIYDSIQSNTISIDTIGAYDDRIQTLSLTVDPEMSNTSYDLKTQPENFVEFSTGFYPEFSDTGYFFYNKLSNSKLVSIKGTVPVFSDGTSKFSMYAIVCNASATPKYKINLLPSEINTIIQSVAGGVNVTYELNKKISIPGESKVWIVAQSTNDGTGDNNIKINPFTLHFSVIKNSEIVIIESSFSDNYNYH